MAYVAVKGGQDAVAGSIKLLEEYRTAGSRDVEIEALEKRMGLLIDRIMGEAGFYAPSYAALALKQSEGSPEEAVFLLRAYRSTLSRSYLSLPLDGADMAIHRRISAAFKDIPGGQFLGATYDYTHRLLDFALMGGAPDFSTGTSASGDLPKTNSASGIGTGDTGTGGGTGLSGEADGLGAIRAPRVSEELKREGLTGGGENHGEPGDQDPRDQDPWDITEEPLRFPAPRSARLQTLARADTGYISGLAYAAIRGFGSGHPTVGELRTGALAVSIPHPLIEGEYLFVGEIIVTEIEALFSEEEGKAKKESREDPLRILASGQGDKADTSANALGLGGGYGMVFGRNDTKAIAMSILDYSLETGAGDTGTHGPERETGGGTVLQNQEFVLLHGDSLEMNGFISHLKLPHYVTFQSKLDRVRHSRGKGEP
jgi:alpha-D-ribose 1-methylphosphonate 5-triphosphate synthase subunit PhnI